MNASFRVIRAHFPFPAIVARAEDFSLKIRANSKQRRLALQRCSVPGSVSGSLPGNGQNNSFYMTAGIQSDIVYDLDLKLGLA
jgi:hypothetical protein